MAAAWLTTLAALAGAAPLQENPPLPPPPFAPDQGLAQPDEGLRALNGEWRLGRTDARLPTIGRAVAWIEAHGVPEQISLGEICEPFAAITVPSNPPVTLRGLLR